ncbi:WXG100 family type VII secretion target [Streptococcus panodentis]|uniref:ESAT-6-like protein n=1 Tax=Streptococcus panodentis TaxID=1581472 RepID=A0ABS5AZ29_9STRE|nr:MULTISPECIES: WXG100 family type VII secretion target [Streptococcus]KXT85353.1 ESAT-6/Esx family secreted protein EsxA/YukE [Streptococcus sp. DD11]MBP2621834.1 WXG100 family type VII secretion target [Streptococcus panodentis]
MAKVSLSPEELIAQAGVYSRARDQIDAAIKAVQGANGEMQSHWEGSAFNSYLQQYDQLQSEVVKFEELLTSINQQLKSYANTVSQRDAADASSFGLH